MVTVGQLADLLGVDATTEATRLQAAIDAVRVVDAEGRPPTDPAWIPTTDLWLAAAHYVELMAARQAMQGGQQVESFTSEGTTIKLASGEFPNLLAYAKWLRSKSPLTSLTTQINVVEIDNDGNYFPRSSFSRSSMIGGVWR